MEYLQAASEEQVLAVAGELLEWLEDGNWPVSGPIGMVLSKYIDGIAHHVVDILKGHDSLWKYWCIRRILMKLELLQIPSAILVELERIALHPSANDVLEEAAEAAREMLSGDY